MANISINSVATRVQYVATSLQTTFSYTFPIKSDADLKVYQRVDGSSPDDAADLLTLTTHYTVTGANTASGGTVVLVTGAVGNDIITIVGDKDIDRTAVYDQSVTLKKADLNNDFNDNVMYDKQIETELHQLGLRYNRSERITPSYREGNLKLPILDDNELWIGRGDAGDSPDDVTTIAATSLSNPFLNAVDYVLGTAESLLPEAQVLGDLATGIVKNTTAASVGTLSIAAEGTDYYGPGGTDVAVADGGTGASTAANALTNLVSGTSIATATVAGTDKVVIQDADDSDNIKTVTAQSIADLAPVGDVVGPASSTDNAAARFDSTTGKLLQDSSVTISDVDVVSGITQLNVDNLRLDGNAITSTDTDGNITLTPDGTGNVVVDARGLDVDPGGDADADLLTVNVTGTPKISWDESADTFRINKSMVYGEDGDTSHTIAGSTVNADVEIHSEAAQDLGGLTLHRHTDTAAYGGHIINLRSNGTHDTPTIVADNNVLSKYIAAGYDGTDYELAAEIRMLVDGTPGNNDMPGEIKFFTNAGSQALVERMAIDAAGKILWPSTVVLDFGAGDVTLTHSTGNLALDGSYSVNETLTANAQSAVQIDIDSSTYVDGRAITINHVTDEVYAGENETSMLVNIDETAALAGEIYGLQVMRTGEQSSTDISALKVNSKINPLLHTSGSDANASNILNVAVDVTAALASGGAGGITAFAADNDTFTIGYTTTEFSEIVVIITTPASAPIEATWEHSTGVGTWNAFVPTDGTNGFQNTGTISFNNLDLAGAAVGAGGYFMIRITRTANTLATAPVLNEIQVVLPTYLSWKKDGAITAKSVNILASNSYSVNGTAILSDNGGTMTLSNIDALDATTQATISASGADYVLIATTTISTDATVEFTNLSSTYRAYVVVFSNVVPVSSGTFNMRTSTDNGSTFDSSTNDYHYTNISLGAASSTITGTVSAVATTIQLTGAGTFHNAPSTGLSGTLTIYRPSDIAHTDITYELQYRVSGGDEHCSGGATRQAAEDVDAIQFYTSAGNLSTGEITLYGIKAS